MTIIFLSDEKAPRYNGIYLASKNNPVECYIKITDMKVIFFVKKLIGKSRLALREITEMLRVNREIVREFNL